MLKFISKKEFLFEIIVTFQMVFLGTASIVASHNYPEMMSDFEIGICFGVSIYVGIMLFGKISNAHMNPAATLLLFLSGKIDKKITRDLIIAQIIGGILASILVFIFVPEDPTLGATFPHIGILNSWLVEFGLTTILLIGVWFVRKMAVPMVALILGTIVFLEAWLAGPLTGASMNPVRSLAPALISGNIEHLWIYLTAPLSASIFVYFLVKKTRLKSYL